MNLVKRAINRIRRTTPLVSESEITARTLALQGQAIEYVIERLGEEMNRDTYDTEFCSALIVDYRRAEASLKARPNVERSTQTTAQTREIKKESYGIELSVVQDMLESGDISRAQAKALRRNVYVMQVDADAGI